MNAVMHLHKTANIIFMTAVKLERKHVWTSK